MTPKVTAFIGVMGAGKDYRAGLLTQTGTVQINFKDPLLDMASDLVGYDVRGNYLWFKHVLAGIRKPENEFQASGLMQASKDIQRECPGALTGRLLLQRLGTDVMRKRDPDYWANKWRDAAIKLMRQGHDVCIADCRFLNEVNAVMLAAEASHGNREFVFCDYHSSQYNPKDRHESEKMAQRLLSLGLKDGEIIPETLFSWGLPNA